MSKYLVNPTVKCDFTCQYQINYNDINGANHLGSDKVLSIAIEAKAQLYNHLGYKYSDIEGGTFFLLNSKIDFIGEGFHGDIVHIDTKLHPQSDKTVIYRCGIKKPKASEGQRSTDQEESAFKEIARVECLMVYVDNESKRSAPVPQAFLDKLKH